MEILSKIKTIKKRVISSVLTAAMFSVLIPMLPIVPETTASAAAASNIQLGQYIKMGRYNNTDILWRCVGFQKISGSTIDPTTFTTAPTSGYVPLMYADTSLCQKAFDGKGSTGMHARNSYRASYGSNYWSYSSLRAWLNSSASAGNVNWPEAVPNSSNVQSNPYNTEAGFMNSFKPNEKTFIMSVTQKELLSKYDAIDAATGNEVHKYNTSIDDVLQNYTTAYAKNTTDSIFLPDVAQLKAVYDNGNALGADYYKARGTSNVWLRAPNASGSYDVRNVNSSGSVGVYDACYGGYGVRPAFFLNQSSAVVLSGDGTSTSPYVLGVNPTLTVSNKTMTYGDSASALSVSTNSSGAKTYSSSNTSVATVSSDGKVTPVAVGSATITVNLAADMTNKYASKSATCTVTVNKRTPTVTAPTAKTLTYSGKAQTLINAGSTTGGTLQYKLGSSGTYSTTVPSATTGGTYTVYYKVVGNANYNDVAEKSIQVTIRTLTPTVTAPTAKTLTYTGSNQALVNAGSTNGGTLQYKLGSSGTYSTAIPQASAAGAYTVYYKVVGNSNYSNVAEKTVSVTIGKANPTVTAPKGQNLTYNGSAQNLVTAGSTTGGTLQYKLGSSGTYSTNIPTATAVGTYTVYYKVVGGSNYNDVAEKSVTTTISATAASITKRPAAVQNLVYNGQAKNLVTAGTASGGTLMYRIGNSGSYSSTLPKGTNAGKYVVWYYVKGDTNHSDTVPESVEVTIGKANSSFTTRPTAKTGLIANGSAQALVNPGTVTGGTLEYSLDSATWSTSVPTATIGGTYTVYYRVKESSNYNGIEAASLSVTLGAGASAMTITPVTATYGDENVILTATISNATRNGIALFAAQNVVAFYIADTGEYLGNGLVTYTNNGTTGTAKLTLESIDRRFKPGVNNIKASYGGGDALQPQEVTSGALTVNRRTVTLTWSGHTARPWNGNPSNVTATAGNLVKGDGRNTDTVTVNVSGGTASNAGQHTATPSLAGAHAQYYKLPVNPQIVYTINKVAPSFTTVPRARTGLSYNGSAQALAIAGSATGGTVMYSLDGGAWSANIPKATNPKTYTVRYKIAGDGNHTDLENNTYTLSVTIAPSNAAVIKAPAAKTLVYDGSTQALIEAGTAAVSFTMKYRLGDTGDYSTTIPTAVTAGTYHVYYMAAAASGNSADNYVPEGYLTVVIEKAPSVITAQEETFMYGMNFSLDNIMLSTPGKDPSGESKQIVSMDEINFFVIKDGEEISLSNGSMTYTNDARTEGKVKISSRQLNKSNCTVGRNTIVVRYAGNDNVQSCESYIYFNVEPIVARLEWAGAETHTYDRTNRNVTARVTNLLTADANKVDVVVTNGTQSAAGTHTATAASLTGDSAAYYSIPENNTKTYIIERANSVVKTAPAAKTLVYDGGPQVLVSSGAAENGVMVYRLNETDDWSSTVPMGTDAGDYTVYYKSQAASSNFNDTASSSVHVTIAKANPIVSAPAAKTLVYDGSAQELVTAAETNGGTIEYKLDNGEWSTDIPTATAAGDYTVSCRIVGNSNFKDAPVESVSVKIDMADVTTSMDDDLKDGVTYGDTFNLTVRLTNRQSGISLFANPDNVDLVLDNGGIQRTIGSAPVQYDDLSKIEGTVRITNVRVTSDFQPGINTIYVKYGGNVNVNGNDTNTVQLNVKPRVLSLDWSGWETRTYEPGTSSNVRAAVGNIFNNDNVGVVIKDGDKSDAGEYTAVAELTGSASKYYALPENFTQAYTIEKADSAITTAPVPIENLAYTGEPQALVTAGETENGTVVYKVGEDGDYSDIVPQVTDAGDYTVYYKINGGTNYKDTEDTAIPVTIAQAAPEVTAPTAKTLVYNGQAQTLLNEGSTNGGTLMYKVGDGEYSEEIPTAAAAGNYKLYYKVEGDNNYEGTEEQLINVTIAKSDSQVTAGIIDIEYNDTLDLTAQISLKDSGISAFALKDTVQFYIGEDQESLDVADVVYTDDTKTEGTATISVKVARNKGFVPGANIITAQYGGDGVNINGSNDNTIIVNVTPIQLDINWSGYEPRAYNGEASNVTAEISGVLNADKDNVSVEVEGGDAANAGEHTATATLTGQYAGYYKLPEDASEQTYVIEKANPEYTVPTGVTAEYGLSLSSVRLPEGWSWEDDSQDVGEIGEHTFKAVYTPEDTDNYNVISDIDVVVSVISGNDYTITDIANAEEDGFVDVSVIKNTQANGVLIVSSYSSEGILIGIKAVNINGITGETPENDTIKVELTCEDGGYISAFVWSALDSMTPMSSKFIK